jgi:hypothetical protein
MSLSGDRMDMHIICGICLFYFNFLIFNFFYHNRTMHGSP